MGTEYQAYPLVELIIRRSRIPRFWFIVLIAAVFVLFLVAASCLDGAPDELLKWRFWQNHVYGIALIVYILATYSIMWRLREQAIQTFRKLSVVQEDFNRVAAQVTKPKRLWELLSFLGGTIIAFALGQPWSLEWGIAFWMSIYMVITSVVLNGLLYLLIYDTLIGAICINRLSRVDLNINIFDNELLAPIGRWSLGISLGFIGGISLSIVLAAWTPEDLWTWQSITMYAILICVTAMIFFLPLLSFHRVMADVRNRKLSIARKNLVEIFHELEDRTLQGDFVDMREMSNKINSWTSYRKLVEEAQTWPYNTGIIRKLFASMSVPAILYLIKILTGFGY